MRNKAVVTLLILAGFYFIWILGRSKQWKSYVVEIIEPLVVPYNGNLSVCSDQDLEDYLYEINKDACKRKPIQSALAFKNRWDAKIPLTWNKNSLIGLEDEKDPRYVWWNNLQNDGMQYDSTKILYRMFEMGFPDSQPLDMTRTGDSKCVRCAVVGSSNNLREKCYGKAIDDHDVVIRFNNAPTNDFHRFVGNKTTYRFAYPESSAAGYPKDSSFFLIPFKLGDLFWLSKAVTDEPYNLKSWGKVQKRLNINITQAYVMHPLFLYYVHVNWTNSSGIQPSSGMFGTVFAMHRCSEVNLFGFGADSNGEWQHYYETFKKGATNQGGIHAHNISKEHILLNSFHNDDLLKIYPKRL